MVNPIPPASSDQTVEELRAAFVDGTKYGLNGPAVMLSRGDTGYVSPLSEREQAIILAAEARGRHQALLDVAAMALRCAIAATPDRRLGISDYQQGRQDAAHELADWCAGSQPLPAPPAQDLAMPMRREILKQAQQDDTHAHALFGGAGFDYERSRKG